VLTAIIGASEQLTGNARPPRLTEAGAVEALPREGAGPPTEFGFTVPAMPLGAALAVPSPHHMGLGASLPFANHTLSSLPILATRATVLAVQLIQANITGLALEARLAVTALLCCAALSLAGTGPIHTTVRLLTLAAAEAQATHTLSTQTLSIFGAAGVAHLVGAILPLPARLTRTNKVGAAPMASAVPPKPTVGRSAVQAPKARCASTGSVGASPVAGAWRLTGALLEATSRASPASRTATEAIAVARTVAATDTHTGSGAVQLGARLPLPPQEALARGVSGVALITSAMLGAPERATPHIAAGATPGRGTGTHTTGHVARPAGCGAGGGAALLLTAGAVKRVHTAAGSIQTRATVLPHTHRNTQRHEGKQGSMNNWMHISGKPSQQTKLVENGTPHTKWNSRTR
jgi:hypothetical protein